MADTDQQDDTPLLSGDNDDIKHRNRKYLIMGIIGVITIALVIVLIVVLRLFQLSYSAFTLLLK